MVRLFRRRHQLPVTAGVSPLTAIRRKAVGRWLAGDLATTTQQSIPNRAKDSVVGPLVRGSVRGAEIQDDGMYQPGTGGNQAVCSSASVGIASAVITSIRIRRTVLDLAPGVPLLYVIGSNAPSRIVPQANLATMYISLYSVGPTQRLESVPLSDAALKYGLRYDIEWDANGTNIPHVEYWYQEDADSAWVNIGGDDWIDEVVRPTDTESVTLSNGSEMIQHEFEIINDGVHAVHADFAAQPYGTVEFDDAQGNTWTVNTTGSDTNDPEIDLYEGRNYFRIPHTGGNVQVDPVVLVDPSAAVTSFVLSRKGIASGSSVIATTVSGPGTRRFYLYMSSISTIMYFTRASDNVAHSAVISGDFLAYTDLRWDVAWNDATGIPVITMSDGLGTVLGVASPADPILRPQLAAYLYMGHATAALTQDVYSLKVYNDDVLTVSINAEHAASSGDWTDPDSGVVCRYILPSSSGLKTRLVTEDALAFDGVDDYMQTDFVPDVQKDSGAFSFYFDGTLTPGVGYHRILGSETIGGDGVYLYRSPTGGVELALSGASSANIGASDTSSDYTDGERFKLAGTVDGEGGIIALATSRGVYDEAAINPLIDAITHGPVRVMSHAYSIIATGGTVYESWVSDEALTEAEMRKLVGI